MENKFHIGKKALRDEEKLLVTSSCSFSHNFFHGYISYARQNVALGGTGLKVIPLSNKLWQPKL